MSFLVLLSIIMVCLFMNLRAQGKGISQQQHNKHLNVLRTIETILYNLSCKRQMKTLPFMYVAHYR